MKVLLIASTDSYNPSLVPIAKKLKEKNESILILFSENEDVHNQGLLDIDIPTIYWQNFKEYNKFDIIIYGNILNRKVLFKVLDTSAIKISLFFHLVINEYTLGGAHLNADLTLCYGQKFIENQKKQGIRHNLLAIGAPFEIDNQLKVKKQILFLEQHFYPSGDKGKQQLANLLIKLAKNYPEYKIVIKPRSLENEKNTKHKAKHIYNYLKKIPSNLVLLSKHKRLEKLIEESEIILTTFSTAITPAIVMNKPIFIIYGFSIVETKYYNKMMINKYYRIYKNSNVLIHYTDVLDKFKNIEPLNTTFKNHLFYKRKRKFDDSIYELLRFIYINKNIPFGHTNIDNYKESKNITNYKNKFNEIKNRTLERFYLKNIITGFKLKEEQNELLLHLNKIENKKYNTFEKEIKEYSMELIEKGFSRILKNNKLFPIGFKEYYIKYFYENNHEKFFKLPKSWKIADYYYYEYLIYKKTKKTEAKKSLLKYLFIATNAEYNFTELYKNNVIENTLEILKKDYNEIYKM